MIDQARGSWCRVLESQKFREALDQVVSLARHGNRIFDGAQPWKSRKTDPDRCGADLAALLELVHAVSVLLLPFLPNSAGKLTAAFRSAAPVASESVTRIGTEMLLAPGSELVSPGILYPRLELSEEESE